MSDSANHAFLASIDLQVPGSDRRGRAFLRAGQLRSLDVEALASELGRCFVEDDDEARLALLYQAMALPAVTVETYPGETSPVELHAYLREPSLSDAPIFACVLATTAVVDQLLSAPPHVVLETASFQVIGDGAASAAIVEGLRAWIGRVWPEAVVPKISLSQWPELEVSALLPAPRIRLPATPIQGAPQTLSTRDFPTPEEAHQR